MNTALRSSPEWLYRLVGFFTCVQIIWLVALMIDFVTHPWAAEYTYQSPLFRFLTAVFIVPSCLSIAVLVVRRAPGNVVGLFLVQWSVLTMGQTLRVDSPLIEYSAINLGWVCLWLLFLYFPSGRAYPKRLERFINGMAVIIFATAYLWCLCQPTMPVWFMNGDVPNLLFFSPLASFQSIASLLETTSLIIIFCIIPLSIPLRFFGSSGEIRQQMKWLAWIGVMTVVLSIIVGAMGITTRSTSLLNNTELVIGFLWSMFVTLMPFVAVGYSILQHLLYDIDIIIRRTLIYSVLSAILAVIYFGGIVLTQQLFRAATGQTSDLAIVVSTLLIAGLFTPLRRRVQDVIDRRLYRRKYDVEQTLADFQKNLREDVDMDMLKANLIGVVSETMQPTKIALWVSPNASERPNSISP